MLDSKPRSIHFMLEIQKREPDVELRTKQITEASQIDQYQHRSVEFRTKIDSSIN